MSKCTLMKTDPFQMAFLHHHLSLRPCQEAWKAIPTRDLLFDVHRRLLPLFRILRLFQSDLQVLVRLIGLHCQPEGPHPEQVVIADQLELLFCEAVSAKPFTAMPCSDNLWSIITFKRPKSANTHRPAWWSSKKNINLAAPRQLFQPPIQMAISKVSPLRQLNADDDNTILLLCHPELWIIS